jgi:hypothetical protein
MEKLVKNKKVGIQSLTLDAKLRLMGTINQTSSKSESRSSLGANKGKHFQEFKQNRKLHSRVDATNLAGGQEDLNKLTSKSLEELLSMIWPKEHQLAGREFADSYTAALEKARQGDAFLRAKSSMAYKALMLTHPQTPKILEAIQSDTTAWSTAMLEVFRTESIAKKMPELMAQVQYRGDLFSKLLFSELTKLRHSCFSRVGQNSSLAWSADLLLSRKDGSFLRHDLLKLCSPELLHELLQSRKIVDAIGQEENVPLMKFLFGGHIPFLLGRAAEDRGYSLKNRCELRPNAELDNEILLKYIRDLFQRHTDIQVIYTEYDESWDAHMEELGKSEANTKLPSYSMLSKVLKYFIELTCSSTLKDMNADLLEGIFLHMGSSTFFLALTEISKLDPKTSLAMRLQGVIQEDFMVLSQDMSEQSLQEFLSKVFQKEALGAIVRQILPFGKLKEEFLEKSIDLTLAQGGFKKKEQEKSKGEIETYDTVVLDNDSDSEELNDEMHKQVHKKKPGKLVHSNPDMLEGYWHEGNPNIGLSTLPHTTTIGYDPRLITLEGLDYCLVVATDSFGQMPGTASLINKNTSQVQALLPGVITAFVDGNNSLVVIKAEFMPKHVSRWGSYQMSRWNTSHNFGRFWPEDAIREANRDDDEDEGRRKNEFEPDDQTNFIIRRYPVFYNLEKLKKTGNLVEYQWQHKKSGLSDDIKGIKRSINYRSSCLSKDKVIGMISIDEKNKFYALFASRIEFDEKPIDLILPQGFSYSAGSQFYLYNWCTRLVIFDPVTRSVNILKVNLVKNYRSAVEQIFTFLHNNIPRQVVLKTELLFSEVIKLPGGSDISRGEICHCNNLRDPFTMATHKKPLPIAVGNYLLDIEISNQGKNNIEDISIKSLGEIKGKVLSLSAFDDQVLVLTQNERLTKARMVLFNRNTNEMSLVGLIRNHRQGIETNGSLILLQLGKKHISQVAALAFKPKRVAEVEELEAINCITRFVDDKIYWISRTELKIISLQNTVLKTQDMANFFEENGLKVLQFTVNRNHSQILLFCVGRGGMNTGKLFRFIINENKFDEILLADISARTRIQVFNSHLLINTDFKKNTWAPYYFSENGELKEICFLGGLEPEKKLLFLVNGNFWIYKSSTRLLLGVNEEIVDTGSFLATSSLFKHSSTASTLGIYNSTHVFFYHSNVDGNLVKKRYTLVGVKDACIESSGQVSFALVQNADGYCMLHRLILDQAAIADQIMKPVGRLKDQNVDLQFNKEETLILYACTTIEGREIKIFDVAHFDHQYTIGEDVIDFPIKLRQYQIDFNFDQLTLAASSSLNKTISIVKYSARRKNRHELLNNFRMRLNLITYEEVVSSLRSFFRSQDPMDLIREPGIFLILANLDSPLFLKEYIAHVGFRRMERYGRLVQWLFSNIEQGKWLRKEFLSQLDQTIYTLDTDLEGLDASVINSIIGYRYTPRLLKEPDARSIFLKLLRVPVRKFNYDGTFGEIIEFEADQEKVDEDNDTGHTFSFNQSLPEAISGLEKSLKSIDSSNLVPYEVFISASPIELSMRQQKCLELFNLLDQCPSDEVNAILRPLVYLKWNKVFWAAFIYICLYWTFAIVSYLFYGFNTDNWAMAGIIIAIGGLMLIYESMTIQGSILEYLKEYWNLVDLTIIIGSIVTAPLMPSFDVKTMEWAIVRMVIVSIIWVRALTWLRIFRPVRYLITMTLRVVYDMLTYLLVLAVAIVTLTFVWRLSYYFIDDGGSTELSLSENEHVPTFFKSLQVVTSMILGNVPDSNANGNDFTIGTFIITVLLGIVMALALTNLLIAIINQTYADVESIKKVHDLREIIDLIVDFDSFTRNIRCCKKHTEEHVIYLMRKTSTATETKVT